MEPAAARSTRRGIGYRVLSSPVYSGLVRLHLIPGLALRSATCIHQQEALEQTRFLLLRVECGSWSPALCVSGLLEAIYCHPRSHLLRL